MILPKGSYVNIADFENLDKFHDHLIEISNNLTLYKSYMLWRNDPNVVTFWKDVTYARGGQDYLNNKGAEDMLCQLIHAKPHEQTIDKSNTNDIRKYFGMV